MAFHKIFFIWLPLNVSVISLPLHKINPQNKNVFEMASDIKDYDEQSENEMIQPTDLMNFKFYINDESRYIPLHSYVSKYNKYDTVNKMQHINLFHLQQNVWETSNTEKSDTPFIAGFKEDLDKKINNHITNTHKDKKRSISSNNMLKDNSGYDDTDSTEPGEEIYDYDRFKKEYEEQIKKNINSNETLNFTDKEKLEEQPKEALQKLVDFKNCTKTVKKFGIKSIECLMYNYEQQKDKPVVKKTLVKIWLVMKVWFFIYICIAVPCWCHKGWCCCCFRFKFCFPKKRILFAKQYYANNPPGVLSTQIQKKEEFITYEPTEFEEDMYEKLETAIRNL